jgi:hypothetical protein
VWSVHVEPSSTGERDGRSTRVTPRWQDKHSEDIGPPFPEIVVSWAGEGAEQRWQRRERLDVCEMF